MSTNPQHELTLILQTVRRGEKQPAEELLPLVYEELRRLATARMAHEAAGHTLQPTALVHEAWMRMVEDGSRTWQNRTHFFCAAAEAMRRILIERARRKSRLKHGGGQNLLDLADLDVAAALPDDKILLMDEALERLKAEDPAAAQVVVLKFFGGLTNEEIVAITKTSDSTVRRQWRYARLWLYNCIRGEM
jgi:RNA polymerase sigma factor (TIGR02999 family)